VPSLNLQPNTRGETAKNMMSFTYRKCVAPTQERKIKQVAKFKTSWIESKVLLGPSRRRQKKIGGIQLRLTPHQIRART
jgi:hypothetical protein